MSFNDLLETDYVKGRLQALKREQATMESSASASAEDGALAIFQNGQAVPGTLEGATDEITVEQTATGFVVKFATTFIFKGANSANAARNAIGAAAKASLGAATVVPLAKLTPGGVNGSLSVNAEGVITAISLPS